MSQSARSPRVLQAPVRPLRADARPKVPVAPVLVPAALQPLELGKAYERIVRAADGTPLFARSEGQGLPIVLCSGVGCHGAAFSSLMPTLARRHQVVHWHHRAHGRSQQPLALESMDVPTLVADLRAVLDAFGLERAVLVGHSLGAQLVLEAALTMPERVLGVVPLCGAAHWPLAGTLADGLVRSALPRVARAARERPHSARKLWRRLVAGAAHLGGGGVQAFLDGLTELDPRFLVQLLASFERHDAAARLAELRAPMLVVAGQRDPIVPVALARRLRDAVPLAELFIVPGGGHLCAVDDAELVAQRLHQFVLERTAPLRLVS